MIRLAISGAAGRMGGALLHAAARSGAVEIAAAFEHEGSDAIGRDAGATAGIGEIGVIIGADIAAVEFDLLLEFTTPAATRAHLEICHRLRRAMLIGTTGLDADFDARLRAAARDIAVLQAANTSIGINLCLELVATAAAALGADSDIEIIEAHHRGKVDAPSGTALSLAHAAAAPLGRDLGKDGVFTRHGRSGARPRNAIGFSVIRGGDIAGEHSVLFIAEGERVEITHKAGDRKIFADGAIRAAKWLAGRPPGMYSMRDVLGLGGSGE
ncbi:MAG: 4-hydroxy-tetrahydrodipicolinate reductase [Gammaproteobacteria bacterium]